ncbi:MAG: hypothetical protein MJ133_07715 [Lachnospiraceae bacterium]|nr:hypothetical protein [Lachnospiraceae bacterium]
MTMNNIVMNKSLNDYSDILTEEEVRLVISEIRLDTLLVPFKKHIKSYSKYISLLGKMNPGDQNVKKNLPNIIFKLYMNDDFMIKKIIFDQVDTIRNNFEDFLKTYEKEKLTSENFKDMEPIKCVEILKEFELMDEFNKIDIDLFFLQLKLSDVDIEDGRKNEILFLWKQKLKKEEYERLKQEEIARALKEQGLEHDRTVKELRKEYSSSISKLNKDIEYMGKTIVKHEKTIEENKLIISNQESEIERLTHKFDEDKEKYKNEWKREIERANKEQIITNNALKEEKEKLIKKKEELEEQIAKMREELLSTEEKIETQKEILQQLEENNDINKELMLDNSKENNLPKLDEIASNSFLVHKGKAVPEAEKYEKYKQYNVSVGINMDVVGNEPEDSSIDHYFNAAIDIGLVPLLCGFGSRRVAEALIAVRYAERPTIISISIGCDGTDGLIETIKEADTKTVIIEDAFGRMNEEILLPVFREEIDKQIILCAESTECIKYVYHYFYNYIQLLKVNVTSMKNIGELIFADSSQVFPVYKIGKTNNVHKNVLKLLKGINISDMYPQTRGYILSRIMELTDHNEEKVYEDLLSLETLVLLDANQKKILKNNLIENEIKISEELLESIEQ